MSQAINKCAMLLNDSEVFSEPKHADIKILEKAQKTNQHWLSATALVLFLLVMMKLLRIWIAVDFASLYIPKDVILDMLPFLLISACLAAFLLFSSYTIGKPPVSFKYVLPQTALYGIIQF